MEGDPRQTVERLLEPRDALKAELLSPHVASLMGLDL